MQCVPEEAQSFSLHAITMKTIKYIEIIAIKNGIIPITATVTSSSVYRFVKPDLFRINYITKPISLVLAKLLEVSV